MTARLRQVALVARDLEPVLARLRAGLGLGEPHRDPDVALFGLRNAVFAIGDVFLEVVAPVREDAAAARHLERIGGDGGYMAMFQVPDMAAARGRVAGAGARVAWEVDLGDIAAMHLHPADVPGAIVSLDCPDPPRSWRWAGPEWTGGAPGGRSAAIGALTVEVPDPVSARRRWSAVLGGDPPGVEFVRGGRGIVALTVERDGPETDLDVCGVRISSVKPSAAAATESEAS